MDTRSKISESHNDDHYYQASEHFLPSHQPSQNGLLCKARQAEESSFGALEKYYKRKFQDILQKLMKNFFYRISEI